MRRGKAVAKKIVPGLVLNLLRSIRRSVQECQQRRFDRRFGVDTSGWISARDFDVDEKKKESGTAYQATPPAAFHKMARSLKIEYERFTFVDIGSGKGAVLLCASRFPFKRIIGVEYSEELNRIAERNIRNYRDARARCREIVTLCMDAAEYSIPEGSVVLYFFYPFKGDLMARVLGNIERSASQSPREIILMSWNPRLEEVLDRAGWLERIRAGWNYAIYQSRKLQGRECWSEV